MKAISLSNSKEIKHENDLDFSVYAVIRLFYSHIFFSLASLAAFSPLLFIIWPT